MSEPVRMPFGKYRGEPLEDIPGSYLEWLLGNTDIGETKPDLARAVQEQLDLRAGMGVKVSGRRREREESDE